MTMPAQPFFVCSLPRSRSAWLANFLTHGRATCYHEELYNRPYNTWTDILTGYPNHWIGHTGSDTLIAAERLEHLFPNAHWVAITRDPEDVWRSSEQVLGRSIPKDFFYHLHDDLLKWIAVRKPLVVEFGPWNTEILRSIWTHCLPKLSYVFDERRASWLNDMNVQIHPAVFRQRISHILEAACVA